MQWSFAQVKGTIDDEVTEGRLYRPNVAIYSLNLMNFDPHFYFLWLINCKPIASLTECTVLECCYILFTSDDDTFVGTSPCANHSIYILY